MKRAKVVITKNADFDYWRFPTGIMQKIKISFGYS